MFDGEERQQAAVTVLFVLVIAAIVLILLGAVALAYYNENLRPLARVGQVEIGTPLLRDRLELEQWRINREGNRLTEASINREIDAETVAAREAELEERRQGLQTNGLEDLIDDIYQSQLAATEGITVTEADVDARVAAELAGVERRHVLGIVVEPVASEGEEAPTISETRAALERAEAALAALESGRDFADVAREFSSHPSAPTGGDFGMVSKIGAPDADWGAELFELAVGETTRVVRGDDGAYRIGRVTEIVAAGEQPGLRAELSALVTDPALRDLLRYEVASDRLRDKITDAALAEAPEQARISVIYIEGLYSEDPVDSEGEIDYSEIVFAPNDNIEDAPGLPETDPAWEQARSEAQAVYDELVAIATGDARDERFAELAAERSDSPTREDGGAVGFVTRGIAPVGVGDALFGATHEPGAVLAPVRDEAAWYVLLVHERRGSPEQRVKAVQDLLAAPGADFAAIAREHSEGPEAEDGGEVGWVTADQLAENLSDDVFALSAGQLTAPLEFGEGHYIIKVEEKLTRPLDADQLPDVRIVAFDNWYSPKKEQAETEDVIVRAGETEPTDEDLIPGGD